MTSLIAARRGGGTALALAVSAGFAAGSVAVAVPARAAGTAVASVSSGTLTYQAGAGQTNTVTIDKVLTPVGLLLAHRVRVDDVVTITPGPGCSPVVGDPTRVTCTVPTVIAVHAGEGNDAVTVTAPIQSVLFGETGNDHLTSGPAPAGTQNFVLGGAGNDSLTGGSGGDLLVGGTGADLMSGGAGTDIASYGDHATPVHADPDGVSQDDGSAAEHDTLLANVEGIWGGSGNDVLTGTDAPNELRGGGGDDLLTGRLGADLTDGGSGRDTVSYADHAAAVTADLDAAAGDDGASGEHDTISTAENLTGGAGNDVLVGDAVGNTLVGGTGNDSLFGGGSNDTLNGGTGDDFLSGGTDYDMLVGGDGKDTMSGGSGIDTVSYAGRFSAVTVRLDHTGVFDDGNALDGAAGARDNIDGTVENVTGGWGADVIVGNAADNTLDGNAGIDYLYGGAGNDSIYGRTQYDYLYGQTGSDLCNVGNGALSDPVEGISFDCESSQPPPA